MPHLHFDVSILDASRQPRTIRGAFDAWFRFPDAERYLEKQPQAKPGKATPGQPQ